MARPNFFAGVDALNLLLQMEIDTDLADIDLTVDVIELPYLLIFTVQEKTWTMRVIRRGDIYDHSDDRGIEVARLVVDKETGDGKGEGSASSERIAAEMKQYAGAFFHVCRNISSYIHIHEMEGIYKGFDPEKEGILLHDDNGELKYKVVAGRERPDLMCESLFNGRVVGRPYMEDFWDRSMREMMPLEEKIQKAEEGDVHCMDELALLYLNGDDDTEADPEKAVYWFRKMAEAGESNGMFNLGLHYAKGHGVPRDFKQAVYWMQKAAEAGDTDAPNALKKYKELADNYEKAVAGDADAQAVLASGYMQLGGSLEQAGTGSDYEESVKWARKAAEQNNGQGIWILGLAYDHGRGVKQDRQKAIELFTKGASLGHAGCMGNLSAIYMNGGVPGKTKEDAFSLMKRAAELGDVMSMHNLGKAYQFGNGVEDDMKQAIYWYDKYLEQRDDPELAQKVAIFKMLEGSEESDEEKSDTAGSADDDGDTVSMTSRIEDLNKKDMSELVREAEEQREKKQEKDHALPAAENAYDEYLSFDLPEDYEIERGVDKDGDPTFEIKYGVYYDDDGDKKSRQSFTINKLEIDNNEPNIDSDLHVRIFGLTREAQYLFVTVQALAGVAIVGHNDHYYSILCIEICDEDEMGQRAEKLATELTSVLNFTVIDGVRGNVDSIPASLIWEREDFGEFREADPSESQHSHWDFHNGTGNLLRLFGATVNQGGTDYHFIPVSESEADEIIKDIAAQYNTEFALSEKAHEMARLFRVKYDAFNAGHDREQEIEGGLIDKAQYYETFRSFAWTFSAYCKDHDLKPEAVDYETLGKLCRFIDSRKYLNYKGTEFCPAICKGDDIHIYYLPDNIPSTERNYLRRIIKDGNDKYISLEALRTDLTYLYPAMVTIYDHLLAERNDSEPLRDGPADILYAWCSMTYAARQPFFTEDGPMHCFFSHPEESERWEAEFRRMREEREQAHKKEWLDKNGKHLNKDAVIRFAGKKFVFDGVVTGDEGLKLQEKLQQKGGIHRNAVSGQTDYLVCEPRRAGQSKINAVMEQRMKGRCRDTKIVLAEDFYKALGFVPEGEQTKEPEEQVRLDTKNKEQETVTKTKEDAKNKADAEQKAWEEEVARIKATREKALSARLSTIEQARNKELADINEAKTNALMQCTREISETIKAVSDMESELYALGFFAFGRKGELRKSIESSKQKVQVLTSEKESITKTYEDKISAINERARADSEKARLGIDKEYPIPPSPAELERKRAEIAENRRDMEAVYEALASLDCQVTVMELIENSESIVSIFSRPKVTRLLSLLVEEGRVRRELIHHKAYFDVIK